MTFISQQTKEKLNIYQKGNCKSEYVIYSMRCTLHNEKYERKVEAAFNIRKCFKSAKNPNAILACKHFQ